MKIKFQFKSLQEFHEFLEYAAAGKLPEVVTEAMSGEPDVKEPEKPAEEVMNTPEETPAEEKPAKAKVKAKPAPKKEEPKEEPPFEEDEKPAEPAPEAKEIDPADVRTALKELRSATDADTMKKVIGKYAKFQKFCDVKTEDYGKLMDDIAKAKEEAV